MSETNYPIYQYSYFLPNGAQVVVRHEKYDEFQERVEAVLEDFPAKATSTSPNVPPTPTTEAQGVAMCPLHHKEMKNKVSKVGKPYTAHWRKLPDGEFDICFGTGWQSERKGQSVQEIKEKLDNKKDVNPDEIPF